MWRKFVTPIGAMQIAAMLSFLVFIIVLARLFHHQSESVFIDFWSYAGSFQIAFPPLAILIASYALAFLGGRKLSDIPADTISFMRNRFFQSRSMMVSAIGSLTLVCFGILFFTETRPPPVYDQLVSSMMSSEVDNSENARRMLKIVAEKNPQLAEQMSLVVQTFELRRKTNLEARVADIVQSRLLLRALSSDADAKWTEHPLRKHALAEANSLLGEAIQKHEGANEMLGLGSLSPDVLFHRAIELYQQVADAPNHRLVTEQLRASALNNIGNVYSYMGDYRKALAAWQRTIDTSPLYKNVGTLGNIVVAHVILGNFATAIKSGEESRAWAEENGKALQDTSHFAGILVSTGFAYLEMGDVKRALSNFELSALVQDDNNTRINAALVHSINGTSKSAETFLRKVSSPLSYREAAALKEELDFDQRCSHLIWALYSHDTDGRDVAARLYVFTGEKHSVEELEFFSDPAKVQKLRKDVSQRLSQFPGSCAFFGLLPKVVAFVAG